MSASIHRLAALALLCGWIVSMLLPVNIMGPGPGDRFPGWMILLLGPLGMMVFQFGWLANLIVVPVLIAVAVRGGPARSGRGFLGRNAPIALGLLGVDALFWREMYGDNGTAPILHFGVGYYLWFAVLAGTILLLVAGGRMRRAAAGDGDMRKRA